MVKNLLLLVFSHVATVLCAQQLSTHFQAIVKERPGDLKVAQHTDGNYLIYGDVNYYENTACGSLIKVDQQGKRIAAFQTFFVDQPIRRVEVLPSGEILVLGNFRHVNGNPSGSLVLLNPDGSLVPGFSIDPAKYIGSFVVQSTGKIVIAYSPSPNGSYYPELMARLNSDGTPDATFVPNYSLNGISTLRLGLSDQLYIADFVRVQRLQPDGAQDNAFALQTTINDGVGDFIVQPDGRVLAATTSWDPVTFNFSYSLWRFETTGARDNAFANPSTSQQVTSIIMRKNGKIAVTGLFFSIAAVSGVAMELNLDGTVSRSLGTANTNAMYAIYEDASQNLFITGIFSKFDGFSPASLIKLRPDYTVDRSFRVPVSRTAGSSFYTRLGIQTDGRLLVAGTFTSVGVGSDTSKIIRVNADGSPDPSFKAAIRNMDQTVTAMAVGEDNKIVAGGFGIFDGPSHSLARLLPDGQMDNTFQIGSGPTKNFGTADIQSIRIRNSRIYVVGHFNLFDGQPHENFVLLDQDGKLIGTQQNTLPPDFYHQDSEVQSDGKIVIMGSFAPLTNNNFIRLNMDGSVDPTFSLNVFGNCMDFEIDENDNILVGGNNLASGMAIALRFFPNGSADNSFSIGSHFGATGGNLSIYQIKAQNDGRIAFTGLFDTYDNKSTPGVVVVDAAGIPLLLSDTFDDGSFGLGAAYGHRNFYTIGKFSKDQGQQVSSALRILQEIEASTSHFEVTSNSESTMDLTWEGDFDGAETITIEQSTPDNSHYQVVANLQANATSYKATDLQENTVYYFKIHGQNEFYTSSVLEGNETTLSHVVAGLEDEKLSIDVYPVPAGDQLTVRLPSSLADADATIYSVSGSTLHRYVLHEGSTILELNELPKGMMFLVVSVENEKKRFRILHR